MTDSNVSEDFLFDDFKNHKRQGIPLSADSKIRGR